MSDDVMKNSKEKQKGRGREKNFQMKGKERRKIPDFVGS